MEIKRICILAPNPEKWIQQAKERAAKSLSEAGFEVIFDVEEKPDFCLCIGGDGSMLAAIRRMGSLRGHVPVSGVHCSKGLGFLYPTKLPESPEGIKTWASELKDSLLSKNYRLEKRWGLEASLDSESDPLWAMNDLVLSKGRLSRMVKLRVKIDGTVLFDELRGDGLIASSATGSTAYSLSAGGPVLSPELDTILLTPICPHEIAQRPFVLDGDSQLQIDVLQGKAPCFLTEDGQSGRELKEGDRITVTRSKQPVQWLIPRFTGEKNRNYFEVLRDKLGFGKASSHPTS